VIEPRNIIVGKDDVFTITEINTNPATKASRISLPRGLRAWHEGHREYVVTREALDSLARRRVCRATDNKGSEANGNQGVG
jgi:cobalamin biosynthesis protein CobT